MEAGDFGGGEGTVIQSHIINIRQCIADSIRGPASNHKRVTGGLQDTGIGSAVEVQHSINVCGGVDAVERHDKNVVCPVYDRSANNIITRYPADFTIPTKRIRACPVDRRCRIPVDEPSKRIGNEPLRH